MKCVCISDTHCQLEKIDIPSGDLLIHSGDLSWRGNHNEVKDELVKLASHLPKFKHIVLIAGNHDFIAERDPALMKKWCLELGLIYLDHSSVRLLDYNIFGSAFTPWFYDWAFNVHRGAPIRKKWNDIPENTDILITHGPPFGILDKVERGSVGCEELLIKVQEIKPSLSCFGHIHPGYGIHKTDDTTFVNASICQDSSRNLNQPIQIDI